MTGKEIDSRDRYLTYQCWHSMKSRCFNPNVKQYKNYGARGITVCDRWIESFENFLSDMGVKPKGLTLERINNDGNYEPSNCRWATKYEQTINRRGNRLIQYRGVTKTLTEWAHLCGVHDRTVFGRLRSGFPIEIVLTPGDLRKVLKPDHCKRGHPLSGENIVVLSDGGSRCKACRVYRDSLRTKKGRANSVNGAIQRN